jgi:hypothetical protein
MCGIIDFFFKFENIQKLNIKKIHGVLRCGVYNIDH